MVRIVAALAVLFALAATPAAAAPHQAGYWYVETAGSDASSCGAYAKVDDTLSFGFLAIRGAVSFSITGKGVRRGKRGTFEPDGETFQFEPEFDGRDHLYLDDYLSEEALAAVRSASRLRVTVDDKRVAEMVIKDTGVPEVLDAVIACSKGEAGWWGKGAVEPPPDPNAPRFNKEGFWSLASDQKPSLLRSPCSCCRQPAMCISRSVRQPPRVGDAAAPSRSTATASRSSRGTAARTISWARTAWTATPCTACAGRRPHESASTGGCNWT
jgi:hypothetical protein